MLPEPVLPSPLCGIFALLLLLLVVVVVVMLAAVVVVGDGGVEKGKNRPPRASHASGTSRDLDFMAIYSLFVSH